MRVYLDLCCLKRPFDSQDHPLVRLETEAVVAILAAPIDRVQFVRSASHALENAFNKLKARQEAISYWLAEAPLDTLQVSDLRIRAISLASLGFSRFDSLHIASAELTAANVFVTVDYPLLKRAQKHSSAIGVHVSDPLRLAEEVFGGTAHH